MSATPPTMGPRFEPPFDPSANSPEETPGRPGAHPRSASLPGSNAMRDSEGVSERDPVNLVRRLQRSLQLQTRCSERCQASLDEQVLAERFLYPDREIRSR